MISQYQEPTPQRDYVPQYELAEYAGISAKTLGIYVEQLLRLVKMLGQEWYTLSVEKLKEYLRIAIEANTNLLNTIDVSDFKLYCKGKIDAFQSVLDELR